MVSDWPLWGWYFYSVRFAILAFSAFLAVAFSHSPAVRRAQLVGNSLLAIGLLLLFVQKWTLDPTMVEIQATAAALSRFDASHPGVYAMGDRAGMVGYLLRDPVYQTEGLVSDLAWINHIRHDDDLQTTLRHEGVRYYITSTARSTYSGCMPASEPALAGPDSHRMRSRFCAPPVLVLPGADTPRVFDLTHEP